MPFALEVGFTQGEASMWFPQVDVLRSAQDANSNTAHDARVELVNARQSDPFAAR